MLIEAKKIKITAEINKIETKDIKKKKKREGVQINKIRNKREVQPIPQKYILS